MASLTGFLVVWSLLAHPADHATPVPVSSHYYWSYNVCVAAEARMRDAVEDAGLATLQTTCVPFMKEDPSTDWVSNNVVGPCEPHYYDCGGVDRETAERVIATQTKWYSIVQEAQKQPGRGPFGPRPFLTPAQRKLFRGSARP